MLIEHTYALLFYAQCHQFLSSNKFKKTGIMTDESSAACNDTGNHNQDDTGRAQDPFYSNAAHYWGTVPANIEGMLGGFGHISSTDIGSSFKFLRSFIIVSTCIFRWKKCNVDSDNFISARDERPHVALKFVPNSSFVDSTKSPIKNVDRLRYVPKGRRIDFIHHSL